MGGPFTERDWKYMRSIRDEMLDLLCTRINEQAVAIATAEDGTPHERYLELFRHINDSDKVVAACFNDWRRSALGERIVFLRSHGLLADSQLLNLSGPAREWIAKLEGL